VHAPLLVIVFSSTFGFDETRLSASDWEDGEGGRGQEAGSISVEIKSESDCGSIENPSSFPAPEMEVRFGDCSAEDGEERDGSSVVDFDSSEGPPNLKLAIRSRWRSSVTSLFLLSHCFLIRSASDSATGEGGRTGMCMSISASCWLRGAGRRPM